MEPLCATKFTLFELVYRQEAMLSVCKFGHIQIGEQNDLLLSADMYHESMMDKVYKLTKKRMKALKEMRGTNLMLPRITTGR